MLLDFMIYFILPFMLVYILLYFTLYKLELFTNRQKKLLATILSLTFVGFNTLYSQHLVNFINYIMLFIFGFFLLMFVLGLFNASFNPHTYFGKFIILMIITSGLYLMLNPFFGQLVAKITTGIFFILRLFLLIVEIITKK